MKAQLAGARFTVDAVEWLASAEIGVMTHREQGRLFRAAVEALARRDGAFFDRWCRYFRDPRWARLHRPPIPLDVKRAVFNRDGGRCRFCGATDDLEYDHVVRFRDGGVETVDNLRLLCGPCNRRRG